MAYFKPLVFGIKCDKCGKTLVYKNQSCFGSENMAKQFAIKAGWSSIGDRHICNECTKVFHKDGSLTYYQIHD